MITTKQENIKSMVDPVTIGILVAVGGGMKAMKDQNRRKERLSKAQHILSKLADQGCDLHQFVQVCKNRSITQAEIHWLVSNANSALVNDAEYLIGLYGRSETTRNYVDKMVKAAPTQNIQRRTELAEARSTIPVLVEGGYDIAALQQIAQDAQANGWLSEQIAEAAQVLWDNDTAKEELRDQSLNLIEAYMEDGRVVELVNGVAEMAIQAIENTGQVLEITASVSEAIYTFAVEC